MADVSRSLMFADSAGCCWRTFLDLPCKAHSFCWQFLIGLLINEMLPDHFDPAGPDLAYCTDQHYMTAIPRFSHRLLFLISTLAVLGPHPGLAQEPVPNPPSIREGMSLKPLPPFEIPTDPPPHEGALIDFPIVLEPPDILVVEVLEALPGRPITGERLIRSDGTISLGFYGDVHVRDLTLEQAKVKIILHLRRWLSDSVLGLVSHKGQLEAGDVNDLMPVPNGEAPAPAPPTAQPQESQTPSPRTSQRTRLDRTLQSLTQLAVQQSSMARQSKVKRTGMIQVPQTDDVARAFEVRPLDLLPGGVAEVTEPQDSSRVFIDIARHNTKVYYVQGDVGAPGRLPFTGKETVLDALNFASGLIPTAEPTDIHLHRPGAGGKPALDYKIDHAAILRGDSRANLQIFPNDRLVVGRNAIVRKTIDIDRANALTHGIFTNYVSLNTALRSVNPNATNESRLQLPEYFETVWKGFADDPQILNDPDRFRAFVADWLNRTHRPR